MRDGIGYGVDGAMDPLSYFLPFIWDRLGMRIGDTVNDRSLNLDLFQGFEETTIDMYSAVRNGYLQRRYNLIHGRVNSARRGAGLPSELPPRHQIRDPPRPLTPQRLLLLLTWHHRTPYVGPRSPETTTCTPSDRQARSAIPWTLLLFVLHG